MQTSLSIFSMAACLLDADIVRETINIRRQHKIKLPDAIIAATALVYKHVLVTRNTTDFKLLAGLQLLDSHSL